MDKNKKPLPRAVPLPAAVGDSSGDVTDEFYPTADDSIHGYGCQLMVGDGAATENFEAIAGITKITPGAMQTSDIKTTHLRSPDAHEEHRPGIRDSAAFSVDAIWLPKSQSQSNAGGSTGVFANGGLIAMWRDRKIRNFKIVLFDGDPDATPTPIPNTELPFRGYVSQYQPTELNNADVAHVTVGFMPSKAYDTALP